MSELRPAGMFLKRAFLLIGLACLGPSCMPMEVGPDNPPPTSAWSSFSYTFDLKEKDAPPNSVPITVAVVNAKYKLEESALKMDLYKKLGKGFSASMGVDLNRIIIAKGMTSRGPFTDLDEITYKDKENSTLTLYPEVFIEAKAEYPKPQGDAHLVYYQVNGQRIYRMQRNFILRIGGWIAFNMEEPLTHQKMWVKRLNLDEATLQGIEIYEANEVVTGYTGLFNETPLVRYDMGAIEYDGKVDILANFIKSNYTAVMQKCWTYLEPEEALQLKKQCVEIRVKSGFSIPK